MELNQIQRNHLWEFARGDAKLNQFQSWLYSDESLEGKVSQNLYLQLIGCIFSNQEAVRQCREALWMALQQCKKCECGGIRNIDSVFLYGKPANDFVYWNYDLWDKTQVPQSWPEDDGIWEYISTCEICHTKWLVIKHPRSIESTRLERFQP